MEVFPPSNIYTPPSSETLQLYYTQMYTQIELLILYIAYIFAGAPHLFGDKSAVLTWDREPASGVVLLVGVVYGACS